MERVLRVLVVDDSAYVRKMIRQMLSRSPYVEVVGAARDGEEALEMVEMLEPDVVTLDLIMPRMNGVEFLRAQMARKPIPVIVVSIASESGEMALEALDAGAIDFVQKPTALATEKIFEIAEELLGKVRAAASASLSQLKAIKAPEASRPPVGARGIEGKRLVDAVVLGISTGGPQALRYLIPRLPKDLPVPFAMVLHMPVGYTEMYAKALNDLSAIDVKEAREGDLLRPGLVLLAPAGRHMTFRRSVEGVVAHLDARPFDTPHRPSVDVLFQSAAETYRDRVLGVVMTGMGSDGKQGSAWIKAQGGLIYTEAEESCVIYGMPRSVVEAGLSDRAVALDRMAEAIRETV
ncbi:MAG: chemotaxis response regulator protein-glutamate methylesterase [Acidobacteriota bacterium]